MFFFMCVPLVVGCGWGGSRGEALRRLGQNNTESLSKAQ